MNYCIHVASNKLGKDESFRFTVYPTMVYLKASVFRSNQQPLQLAVQVDRESVGTCGSNLRGVKGRQRGTRREQCEAGPRSFKPPISAN
jgi:hypothetical protein